MSQPELQQIALNAIRWRSKDDNDGKLMAQGDRRWLLRYIEQQANENERLRAALTNTVAVFADGLGAHKSGPYCSLTDEGHEAIEQARAALDADA